MVIERRNQWFIAIKLVCFFLSWQCEAHGIPLPTLDEVDNKATQFNEARHYMYNEDDVDKVQYMNSESKVLCKYSSEIKLNFFLDITDT